VDLLDIGTSALDEGPLTEKEAELEEVSLLPRLSHEPRRLRENLHPPISPPHWC
jgi:hypothetical protein